MKKPLLVPVAALMFLAAPCLVRAACCIPADQVQELVSRYAPVLVQGEDIPAPPGELLFRAATSEDCRTLRLAYHVVWEFERDPGKGFWPALTRATYTGGLRLQRIIFGPGDVEALALDVDLETSRVTRVRYETARYGKRGEVIHVPVVKEWGDVPDYNPLYFEVISWNHLFDLLEAPPGKAADKESKGTLNPGSGSTAAGRKVYRLDPEPFTDELWKHYRMTKKREHMLSRDRAHYCFELGLLCPVQSP